MYRIVQVQDSIIDVRQVSVINLVVCCLAAVHARKDPPRLLELFQVIIRGWVVWHSVSSPLGYICRSV